MRCRQVVDQPQIGEGLCCGARDETFVAQNWLHDRRRLVDVHFIQSIARPQRVLRRRDAMRSCPVDEPRVQAQRRCFRSRQRRVRLQQGKVLGVPVALAVCRLNADADVVQAVQAPLGLCHRVRFHRRRDALNEFIQSHGGWHLEQLLDLSHHEIVDPFLKRLAVLLLYFAELVAQLRLDLLIDQVLELARFDSLRLSNVVLL